MGPHAWDAIELLERLAEHEDAQLAARAQAALRSIRAKDD